ncbi:MAG TPA: hypothetical protein VHB21_00320 [Minicystis sp.]|nr:hypothetical protein [Minicystis sp.]
MSEDFMLPGLMFSVHASLAPGPPVLPFVETPVPMWWPPGRALGQNKFASSVKHLGQMIALQGHDCGAVLPHMGLTVPGLWVAIATSSRRFVFSTSTVRACGSPLGAMSAAAGRYGLVCGVVPLPIAYATNWNTVRAGLTHADDVAGWAATAVAVVVGLVGIKVSGGAGAVIGLVAGIIAGAIQIAETGQGSIGVSLGTPPLGASVSVSVDNGQVQSAQAGVGPFGGQVNRDGSVQGSGPAGTSTRRYYPFGGPAAPTKPPQV